MAKTRKVANVLPMPIPIKRPPVFRWGTMASFTLLVDGKKDKLAMFVQPMGDKWHVLSLSTPLSVKTGEEILENHAHKIVGIYETPQVAFGAAESFASAWLEQHKSTRAKACGCDEIR